MNTEMINTLKENLKSGIVFFEYTKLNGDIRYAVGTTNHDILESMRTLLQTNAPISNGKRVSESTITYFDISRLEFRQFRKENLRCVRMTDINFVDALILALAIAFSFDSYSDTEYNRLFHACRLNGHDLGEDAHMLIAKEIHDNNGDIEKAVQAAAKAASHIDHQAAWCMKYNGGRGLNGVMLAAGGRVSSRYDCFGNPIGCRKVSTTTPAPTTSGLVEGVHFDVINDGEEVGIRETPKAEVKAEPKAEPMTEIKPTELGTKILRNTRKFDLVKSLLSGLVSCIEEDQDLYIDAAFEMADKVLARLAAE